MEHWITEYSTEEELKENINGDWELESFSSEKGPITIANKSDSKVEISIVKFTNTGTFRIEYDENIDDFNSNYTGESESITEKGFKNILEFLDWYTSKYPEQKLD